MEKSLFSENSIIQLRELIKEKEISSRDLFENFLKFYNHYEPKVHAWVRINETLISSIIDSTST